MNPEAVRPEPKGQRMPSLAGPTAGLLETIFAGLARLAGRALTLRPELREAPPLKHATPPGALLESAPVAIYHTDATGNLTYVNPAYRRIFDLTPEQSVNDWAQGVHRDDRERMEQAWADFCARPRPVRFEYRTEPRGRAVRFFAEQVVAVEGAEGFVGNITDVTDLIAARDNLRRMEGLFRDTFEQLPVALLACDVSGRITHVNHAATELFSIRTPAPAEPGSSERYALAAEVYLADGVTRLNRPDHPLARALRGEIIDNLELVIVPCESTARTTLSNARRLVDSEGQTLGAVAVIQDITERKLSDLELERVHKELMTASRQAGMAEVATNVLHNVGNILNSVNISASLVAERIKQSKAPGLSRVAALLQEQGEHVAEFIGADVRGKRIPDYLATLGEQLVTDQKVTLQEIASLRENLEHIKDTVAMQQNYAKLCGVTETVKVVDLIEDSLRLNAGAFARHGVALRREFNDAPEITVDKHKVLQILVNLVRNAKYACDESGRQDKLLTLRVESHANGVRISVIDNGVGIPAENMSRLFNHGFTTRQSGHGFGLHSGALAAQELGGSLRAASDGPGLGAAFILELPYAPADAAHG